MTEKSPPVWLCQFQISIVVERPDGREIAKPVELRVMVGDANDNRPTFPQGQYHTVVKELAARGEGGQVTNSNLPQAVTYLVSHDTLTLTLTLTLNANLNPTLASCCMSTEST